MWLFGGDGARLVRDPNMKICRFHRMPCIGIGLQAKKMISAMTGMVDAECVEALAQDLIESADSNKG